MFQIFGTVHRICLWNYTIKNSHASSLILLALFMILCRANLSIVHCTCALLCHWLVLPSDHQQTKQEKKLFKIYLYHMRLNGCKAHRRFSVGFRVNNPSFGPQISTNPENTDININDIKNIQLVTLSL